MTGQTNWAELITTRTDANYWRSQIEEWERGSYAINQHNGHLSAEEQAALVKQLREWLDQAACLNLTVAFHPSYEQQKRWLSLARQRFGEKLFLDTKYNPDLIGGAVVEMGGKRYDGSIMTKYEKL